MSARESVTYQYLEVDLALERVATRYQTDVASIWSETRAHVRRFASVETAEKFVEVVRYGDRIVIPFAGDAWEWAIYEDVKEGSLAAACANKNAEPELRGGLHLTPSFLWNHIFNSQLRAACLARFPDFDEKRVLDANPEDAAIRHLTLSYPRPRRLPAAPIRVAPNARAGGPARPVQTNVAVPPRWLVDLVQKLDAIDELTGRLTNINDCCEELQKFCTREAGHAVVLHLFLEVLHRYTTAERSKANIRDLGRKVEKLIQIGTEIFIANPAAVLRPELNQGRMATATALLAGLRDADFFALVRQASADPDQLINGVGLYNKIARTINGGYREVVRTQLAAEGLADIEAAVPFISKATGGARAQAHPEAPNALAALLSIVNVKPLLFGNLPGPATLSAHCTTWLAWKNLPSDLGNHSAAALRRANWRRALIDMGALSVDEFVEIDMLTVTGKREDLERAVNLLTARIQRTPGFTGALAFANAYMLYTAITTDDPFLARKVSNILGCGFGAAESTLAWLAALKPGGALESVLTKGGGKFFGVVGAVASIISGGLTFYEGLEKRNGEEMLVGGLQAVGGILSVAGFFLAVPLLEVAGVVILIAAAALTDWDSIKEAFKSGPRRIFLAQMAFLKSQEFYSRALAARPDLKAAFDAVESAASVENGDPSDPLPELLRSGAAVEDLRGLGFDRDDIDLIAPPLGPTIFVVPGFQ